MWREFDTELKSARNTLIPTTIIETDAEKAGLVLFVHGFKADRTEGDRFTTVGRQLAPLGINSIYIDFPGCHESKEEFSNYCMSNCLSDMEIAYQYMLEHYAIDMDHLAMVGYSMGGRLTCIFTQKHPEFQTIGLWAAATYNDYGGSDMFLDNNVETMESEANEKGYCLALNSFDNTYLKMSKQFFDDMHDYRPFDALKEYQGNVIMVHGEGDITVDISYSEKAYEALTTTKNKKFVRIPKANHGFGLWDNHMEQSKILTDETFAFIVQNI